MNRRIPQKSLTLLKNRILFSMDFNIVLHNESVFTEKTVWTGLIQLAFSCQNKNGMVKKNENLTSNSIWLDILH